MTTESAAPLNLCFENLSLSATGTGPMVVDSDGRPPPESSQQSVVRYTELQRSRKNLMKEVKQLDNQKKALESGAIRFLSSCPDSKVDLGEGGLVSIRHKNRFGSLGNQTVLAQTLFQLFNGAKPFKITTEEEARRLALISAEYAVNNKPVISQNVVIQTRAPPKKKKKFRRDPIVFPLYNQNDSTVGADPAAFFGNAL